MPAMTAPGEIWHPSIRKLIVHHESEGVLGTIYCDLTARRDKFEGAAHFTVRCSRRMWECENGTLLDEPWRSEMNERVDETGRWTMPVVVLVTSFGEVGGGRRSMRQRKDVSGRGREMSGEEGWTEFSDDITLSFAEMETLVHEMGHAMHCKFLHSHISKTLFHKLTVDGNKSDAGSNTLSTHFGNESADGFRRDSVDAFRALCFASGCYAPAFYDAQSQDTGSGQDTTRRP